MCLILNLSVIALISLITSTGDDDDDAWMASKVALLTQLQSTSGHLLPPLLPQPSGPLHSLSRGCPLLNAVVVVVSVDEKAPSG